MAETIRLNKVLKELNISIDRAVDFLDGKGVQIDRRPTTKIDHATYEILVEEFRADAEQKAASEEVVLSKIPKEEKIEEPSPKKEHKVEVEEKPKTVPEQKPVAQEETKPEEEAPAEEKIEEVKEEEEASIEEKTIETIRLKAPKLETKNLGKIDLDALNKKGKKEEEKPETKHDEQVTPEPIAEKEAETKPEEEPKTEKPEEERAEIPSSSDEPEKIETKYQKLSGPQFTGEKVDLSKFEKRKKENTAKKEEGERKKRKRIRKPSSPRPGAQGGKDNRNRNQGRGRGKQQPNTAELSEEDVQKQIKETLEKLTNKGKGSKGAKHRRDKRKERQAKELSIQEEQEQDRTLQVTEFASVQELAALMDVAVTDVISACMSLGVMVTMNQRLEAETIQIVAEEFGFEAQFAGAEDEGAFEEEIEDTDEDLEFRPPIVTIMGHVDHGKTSLLDYIRSTNVIAGESGGITQHIGAYGVELPNKHRIAFLDTPGHEAFTAMRARGAQVTDIVIIVIAADDGIKPQTKEAISHAQAAGVPIIIAINKVDKPTANPDKVREELSAMNILVEDWGGKYQAQEISAKTGLNVNELLEKVLLEAEILELKANPNRPAAGTIIEASLDKGRGYVSTIMVQNGTLRVGDYLVAGKHHGKVRAMLDERGHQVESAGPSTPVTILGLDGAPTAGDKFRVFEDEREGKQLAQKREQLQREQTIRTQKQITLDEIGRRIAIGDFQELNIILKGDVDGSVEAISDSLQKLSTEEIHVNILHRGVGQITESDVLLASASDAVVLGFNVRPASTAREIAEKENIEIRTYSIIYDAINDVKEAMEGMLSPEMKEQVVGNVEIRETFKISKIGTIAGCMVLDGKITRNSNVRVIRDGVVIHDGELDSLKRFKDDVKEVNKGYECGLNIKNFNDIKEGDIIEAYETIAVKKTLGS